MIYVYSMVSMTSLLNGAIAAMSGHYGYAIGLIAGAWAWFVIASDIKGE
jgi:hypothetical protein